MTESMTTMTQVSVPQSQPKSTLWSQIFKAALMVVPMGTQSTHTIFGTPRPHQFFGAGPQSFTT